ncbi:MAG: YihY/virulence factor BrkB family protein [Anaerolineaceae bacterium]|nr:YihY/virulence factor BrkB family protein [Anaerolineaceae bacterium]
MSDKQQQDLETRRTRGFDAFMAVVIDSLTSLFNNYPTQAAAAIAYYFLFSIFPLLLFVVIFLSYFLDISYVQDVLIHFVQEIIPGSEVLIYENLQNILTNRGSTSIIASVSLLWSGSGVINSIISNIQKAYPESNMRGFFINRALAIALILLSVVLIGGLLVFSLVFDLSDALAFFNIELTKPISRIISIVSTYVLPILILYLIGFILYHDIPTAKVDRQAARIAALLFAVVWRAFTTLFGNYVLSPMNRYDLLYGSVTVIVLLLLYMYFTAFIILYPAHLAAAITHYKQRRSGILATAPINPRPIQPKAPQRGKKKKSSGQNSGNTRTLSDPVYLDPNVGKKPQKSVWKQIWEFVKGLFRWK